MTGPTAAPACFPYFDHRTVGELDAMTAYPNISETPALQHGAMWCDQCDRRVSHGVALGCRDRFCSLRKAA